MVSARIRVHRSYYIYDAQTNIPALLLYLQNCNVAWQTNINKSSAWQNGRGELGLGDAGRHDVSDDRPAELDAVSLELLPLRLRIGLRGR